MDRKWWTLAAVCIGTFMLLLDITIVMVALPTIQHALGADFSQLQWVLDAYAVTLSATLLMAGSLADRFGHRRFFIGGLALFATASLACGLAQSALVLVITRSVQGIGGAVMFSTALALLGNQYRGSARKVAFAVWGAVTGISVAVGPLAGGALISWLSWRWIFLVNVPIGLLAMLIAFLRVPDSRAQASGPVDWLGFLSFSAAVASLVCGLIRGTPDGWLSAPVLGCLIASPLLLAIFVAVERRAPNPVFVLGLLRKPAFLGASIAAFAINATLPSTLLFIVLYLQNVLGYGALDTGVRLLVLSAGVLACGALAGRLSGKVPPRLLLTIGLALTGTGLLLMRGGLTPVSGWTSLAAGMFVGGAGMGLVNPVLASLAVDVVSSERAGMGAGINNTFRQVGVATGIAGLGAIFQAQIASAVLTGLHRLSGVTAPAADRIASALTSGHAAQALGSVPTAHRQAVAHVARLAFISGMSDVFLVAALVAFAGAGAALILVRGREFAVQPAERTASRSALTSA